MRRVLNHPLTQLAMLLISAFVLVLVGVRALWAIFGVPDPNRLDAGSALPAIALELMVALAVLGIAWRVVERRPPAELGFPARYTGRNLLGGLALGAALMSAVIGFMAVAGWYEVTEASLAPFSLMAMTFIWCGVAFTEEWFARGVILRLTERAAGSWIALAVSSTVFGLAHLANPNAGLLSTAGIVTAGVLLGAAYLLTRSLWFPIGIHVTWNMFQGTVFGVPVSGYAIEQTPLLRGEIAGPRLWTGGAFGPEAGLIGITLPTVAGLVILVMAVRRGNIHPMRRRTRRRGLDERRPAVGTPRDSDPSA
jgi:membrane protease YdiL (CAAX protease family)